MHFNRILQERAYVRKKRREILMSCVFLLALLVGASALGQLTQITEVLPTSGGADNWGLSFPQPGQTPQGNADADYLADYNAYYVGDTGEKVIYLTFDAGFENGNTEAILNALKKHNAPATFFLVGSYVRDHGDLVQRMVAEGHTVGNHTNTHPDMSAISDMESFANELRAVEESYTELMGTVMPKFYRPPQGKYSEANLAQAKELGYTTVFWSLAYVDWYENDQPTHEEAFEKLLGRIHPGAIVLLHSTSKTNAEILDELLTRWEDMGYTFKPLAELPSVDKAG